jgi:hypothetical protein
MVAEFRLDLPNQVSGVVNIQKKKKRVLTYQNFILNNIKILITKKLNTQIFKRMCLYLAS